MKVNGKEVPRDTGFATFELPESAIVELDYVSHLEPIGEHIPPIVLKLACKILREDFESFSMFKKKVLRELRFYRKITALDAFHAHPNAAETQQEPAAAEVRQSLQKLTINQRGHLLSSIRWLASLFVFKSHEVARILKNSARSVDDFVTAGTYMFSRISDKHQFKTVLKEMPHEACHRTLTHIGFLRIIHAPTAYGLYFKLRMGVPEEREYCNIIIKHVVRYKGTTELAGLRLKGNLVQNVQYDSSLWKIISGQLYDSAVSEEGGGEAGRGRSSSGTSNVVEFLLQGPDADGWAIQSAIRIQAQWRNWAQRKIFLEEVDARGCRNGPHAKGQARFQRSTTENCTSSLLNKNTVELTKNNNQSEIISLYFLPHRFGLRQFRGPTGDSSLPPSRWEAPLTFGATPSLVMSHGMPFPEYLPPEVGREASQSRLLREREGRDDLRVDADEMPLHLGLRRRTVQLRHEVALQD